MASLGVDTYAIRECSRVRSDQNEVNKVASQIFSINMFMMFLAYAALFSSLLIFNSLESYQTLVLILSVNIVFKILGADWINSAYEDFKYITIRTVIVQVAALICIFLFVKSPQDYFRYALIMVLAASGANIINIIYRRHFCKIRMIWDIHKIEWGRHFLPILSFFAMLLVQTIFNSSDTTMLGVLKGDYAVGLYSVAVRVSQVIAQVLTSILWVVLPRLSQYYDQKNYNALNGLLKTGFQFMVGLGFPCIVGACLFSREIVWIAGGAEYAAASEYLVLLMISIFFSLLGGSILGNMIMLPSNREKIFLQACALAAVVNVILNFIFIPHYGATAASVTTILAHMTIWLVLLPRVEKEIALGKIYKSVLVPAIGCFIIAVWVLFVKHLVLSVAASLVIGIAGSVVLYAFVLWLFHYEIFVNKVIPFIVGFIKK